MSDEAKRFRQRAYDCRQLAKGARDRRDQRLLEDIADDLEVEADKMDDEDGDEATPNDD
jgi:hypothetical protein